MRFVRPIAHHRLNTLIISSLLKVYQSILERVSRGLEKPVLYLTIYHVVQKQISPFNILRNKVSKTSPSNTKATLVLQSSQKANLPYFAYPGPISISSITKV